MYSAITEAKVAFNKACADMSNAVKTHKGVISRDTYEKYFNTHMSIVVEVLNNLNSEPPDPASVTPSFGKAGTVAELVNRAKADGYMPKGKLSGCSSCKKNNRLVTLIKGDETIKACPCGYCKTF